MDAQSFQGGEKDSLIFDLAASGHAKSSQSP